MEAEAELRSALIVAVPEAAPIVDGWRERTSSARPSCGVPPHVTILSPFAPPDSITETLLEDLDTLVGAHRSFAFELATTARFPEVLYLAPSPAAPFIDLTQAVARMYSDFPPYGGAFDSIVPHLTAAEGAEDTLAVAEAEIAPALPITCTASEVLLIEEVEPDSACWRTRAVLPLRPS
jgi:hypothetical protein